MHDACSLNPVPARAGNASNVFRMPKSQSGCSGERTHTGLKRSAAATLAAWVTLAGGGVGAEDAEVLLIEQGRRLFIEETFGGNGRTCATCHPPTNNFTIDPTFIGTLRGNDPLFLAMPSAPHLRSIEVRRLLQQHALVLENVDGPDLPGVLRGVPHTLGMSLSLVPETPVSNAGFTEATGWSGDGSPKEDASADGTPNDGSLRSFAVGAVKQHFTKSPERREGIDFRLPSDDELLALEAFQLSLGRHQEMDLDHLVFTDDVLNDGLDLFNVEAPSRMDTRRCGGCHTNAGANNGAGVNRNRATGASFAGTAPACLRGFAAPLDGGFGGTDFGSGTRALKEMCDGGAPAGGPKAVKTYHGDQTMNTPPVVEAADTTPLFHNNIAATVEDAVRFYTTDTFNDSMAGARNAFVLTEQQVEQIGAFMRGINALENIRSSNEYDQRAMDPGDPAPFGYLVEVALSETVDALEVLRDGPVALFAGTSVLADLEEAATLERQAFDHAMPSLLLDAIASKNQARDQMITP